MSEAPKTETLVGGAPVAVIAAAASSAGDAVPPAVSTQTPSDSTGSGTSAAVPTSSDTSPPPLESGDLSTRPSAQPSAAASSSPPSLDSSVTCDKEKPPKAKSVSQSVRAGVTFPVGRIHRLLRNKSQGNVSAAAAVYMSGVLEYMCAEVLELAGNASKARKRERIDNRDIFMAFQGDEELLELQQRLGAIIPGGGVVPNPALWTKKRAAQPKAEISRAPTKNAKQTKKTKR